MNAATLVFFLVGIVFVGGLVWSVFQQKKRMGWGIVGIVVSLAALLGGWHAWAEARSVPWTVGYASLCVLGMVVAVRHLRART